jgi:protein-disulfide isomerase
MFSTKIPAVTVLTKGAKSLTEWMRTVVKPVPLLVTIILALLAMNFVQWDTNRALFAEVHSALAVKSGAAAPAVAGVSTVKVTPLQANDHVRGDRNAKLLLVEYTDFECPFCMDFHSTLQQVQATYTAQQVALVVRHFPLTIHPGAQKKAEASECIQELGGDQAFWKFVDADYSAPATSLPLSGLASLAGSIGVDQQAFTQCLDSGKMADRVKHDTNDGLALGVQGTPSNYVVRLSDGVTKEIPGALPLAKVKADIESLL